MRKTARGSQSTCLRIRYKIISIWQTKCYNYCLVEAVLTPLHETKLSPRFIPIPFYTTSSKFPVQITQMATNSQQKAKKGEQI